MYVMPGSTKGYSMPNSSVMRVLMASRSNLGHAAWVANRPQTRTRRALREFLGCRAAAWVGSAAGTHRQPATGVRALCAPARA
jgi:hypothetical protein